MEDDESSATAEAAAEVAPEGLVPPAAVLDLFGLLRPIVVLMPLASESPAAAAAAAWAPDVFLRLLVLISLVISMGGTVLLSGAAAAEVEEMNGSETAESSSLLLDVASSASEPLSGRRIHTRVGMMVRRGVMPFASSNWVVQ